MSVSINEKAFRFTPTVWYYRKSYYISSLLILVIILIPYVTAHWNPYEIIGVQRDADLDHIKKAYRELARKLHPDKSSLSEDEAARRFIELNKAFSILKDPDRRSRFDQYGDTEENRHSRGYHNHQNRQTREYWTKSGFRTFTFFSSSEGHLRKRSITTKQYYNEFIKASSYKPFFIFFYSDFCSSCNDIETAWTKITDELGKYNVGSFTINVQYESHLAQELGVNSIPHIACLLDGKIKSYYNSELSLGNNVKITRNIQPKKILSTLGEESEQDRFIALGPQTNKLSALIIHNENHLKLRYLLLAFELHRHYKFGQVSTKSSNYRLLAEKYNLSINPRNHQINILVFNEDLRKPVISTNFNNDNPDINQLKRELLKWPYLQLPRLSSQQIFDDFCLYSIPRDGGSMTTRLCTILFASNTPSSLPIRNKLIEFIELNHLIRDEKAVFAFIDPTKQNEFITSLLTETKGTYPFQPDSVIEGAIIVIEKQTQNPRKAHYKWLKQRWDPKNLNELDQAKIELHQSIIDYKRGFPNLRDKIVLSLLVDEDGPSLIDRVFWRFVDQLLYSFYRITSSESFSTIVILVICALITSIILYQSNQSFSEPSELATNEYQETFQQIKKTVSDFKILELKAETYNGMVRLLKPGHRSIILLTNMETKEKLLVEFRKAVWPYRRNKTLLFGYLCLDKNLNWYKALLEEVLGISDLKVNKKNCIGTVLSLNGFKKYFRVYHAKHHDYRNETDTDGSFLGFEDEDHNLEDGIIRRSDVERKSSRTEEIYSLDNLLERLPIWLDKMFDGLTKRYFLDSWPDEMN